MGQITNILILDTGKEWGGGTNSLLELLRRIDKKHYKFTVLFYHNYDKGGKSDIKTEVEKMGIDFLLSGRYKQSVTAKVLKEIGRTILFFNRSMRRLYVFWVDYLFRIKRDARFITKILKDLQIDLLYMNNQPSTNLEGIIAAKEAGTKSLLHSRIGADLNAFEINAANKWLTKMICVSEGIKDLFARQGINSSKCIVIHDGIDTTITPAVSSDEIKKELGIKKNEILIGAVGSLVKRKRFNDLIDSVSYLINNKGFDQLKCLIVGEGPERDLLWKEIEKHRLNDRVMLTGFKLDALSYINILDVFILTSEREGFPRVILEAMLMGKPVIASRIAGVTELVIDKQTGLLFQAGHTEKLADCISSILSSSQLRKDMGQAGRIKVIDNFSVEKYVSHVNRIIAEVAG